MHQNSNATTSFDCFDRKVVKVCPLWVGLTKPVARVQYDVESVQVSADKMIGRVGTTL